MRRSPKSVTGHATPATGTETLFVCGYPSLYDHLSTVQPHLLISVLGPHNSTHWPAITGIPRLCLEIDDVHRPCNGFADATPAHFRRLVTFLQDWHPQHGQRLLATVGRVAAAPLRRR